MANQQKQNKIYRETIKEKNEKKILQLLTENRTLTWTQLKHLTKISKPQLSAHLKRLQRENKISHVEKHYFIRNLETLKLHAFMRQQILKPRFTRKIKDPKNWLDKNGLSQFNEKQEKERANTFLQEQNNLLLYLFMKLTQQIYKQDEKAVNEWIETCFEDMLAVHLQFVTNGYLEGILNITDSKDNPIGIYKGDKGGFQPNQEFLKNQDKKNREIYDQLKKTNEQSLPSKKIQKRKTLRYQYIIDEFKKNIESKNFRELESSLQEAKESGKRELDYIKKLEARAKKRE